MGTNDNLPKWTVLYSTPGGKWTGTGRQFYDEREHANKLYEALIKSGSCPTLRPYHDATDRPHLGAAHQMTLPPVASSDASLQPNAEWEEIPKWIGEKRAESSAPISAVRRFSIKRTTDINTSPLVEDANGPLMRYEDAYNLLMRHESLPPVDAAEDACNAKLDEIAASFVHSFKPDDRLDPAYIAECIMSHKGKPPVDAAQDANKRFQKMAMVPTGVLKSFGDEFEPDMFHVTFNGAMSSDDERVEMISEAHAWKLCDLIKRKEPFVKVDDAKMEEILRDIDAKDAAKSARQSALVESVSDSLELKVDKEFTDEHKKKLVDLAVELDRISAAGNWKMYAHETHTIAEAAKELRAVSHTRDALRAEVRRQLWHKENLEKKHAHLKANKDLTLREFQVNLPWTIRYSNDFRSSPMTHKDFSHALHHVSKAAGKLHALADDMDHDRMVADDHGIRPDNAKYIADLVVCALRLANTFPGGAIDLQAEVHKRIETKNGVSLGSTEPQDAKKTGDGRRLRGVGKNKVLR